MALKQSRMRETRKKKPASSASYNPWLVCMNGLAARRPRAASPSHRTRKALPRGLQRRVVM